MKALMIVLTIFTFSQAWANPAIEVVDETLDSYTYSIDEMKPVKPAESDLVVISLSDSRSSEI